MLTLVLMSQFLLLCSGRSLERVVPTDVFLFGWWLSGWRNYLSAFDSVLSKMVEHCVNVNMTALFLLDTNDICVYFVSFTPKLT